MKLSKIQRVVECKWIFKKKKKKKDIPGIEEIRYKAILVENGFTRLRELIAMKKMW